MWKNNKACTRLLGFAHEVGFYRLGTTLYPGEQDAYDKEKFEHVVKRSKQPGYSYPAPMLPILKNSRWNGIVYLHGLLPAKTDD